jgi:hypothetical protein
MPGSVQDAQLRQKAAEAGIAGLEEEEKGGGKEAAMGKAALQAAGESAGVRDAALINIENLVTKFKNSVGPLAKPGMLPAILSVVQEGVSAGNFGQVGMPGIEKAVRQLGGGQAEIDAAQELGREFATIQLNNSRSFLKGQGAVSDAERRLIAMMSGTTGDSPGAIKRFVQWQRKLASYDEAIWNDYIKWRKVNKAAKFEDFTLSDTYQNRRKAYTQELVKLAKSPLPIESEKPSGAKKSLDSHPGRALLDKYPKR